MDAPFALFMREDLSVEGMLWTNAMVDPLERRRGASELYEGNAANSSRLAVVHAAAPPGLALLQVRSQYREGRKEGMKRKRET